MQPCDVAGLCHAFTVAIAACDLSRAIAAQLVGRAVCSSSLGVFRVVRVPIGGEGCAYAVNARDGEHPDSDSGQGVDVYDQWHFINLPVVRGPVEFALTEVYPNFNVVWGVNHSMAVLQSPTANTIQQVRQTHTRKHIIARATLACVLVGDHERRRLCERVSCALLSGLVLACPGGVPAVLGPLRR